MKDFFKGIGNILSDEKVVVALGVLLLAVIDSKDVD